MISSLFRVCCAPVVYLISIFPSLSGFTTGEYPLRSIWSELFMLMNALDACLMYLFYKSYLWIGIHTRQGKHNFEINAQLIILNPCVALSSSFWVQNLSLWTNYMLGACVGQSRFAPSDPTTYLYSLISCTMTFSTGPDSPHSSSKAQFKHLLPYEAVPGSLWRGKAPHASEFPVFCFYILPST